MDINKEINNDMNKKRYNPPPDLIITPSGMRGKIGSSLTLDVVIRFSQSFGLWLGKNSTILLGRDTRSSGVMISSAVISALNSVGVNVIDAGICPTPTILFHKRKHNVDGAAIISASHNPPQYNGIKYLSRTDTFLGNEELDEINQYFLYNSGIQTVGWDNLGNYQQKNIIQEYLDDMKEFIDVNLVKKANLNVVVDPDAGAGRNVTSRILKDIGCNTTEINADFISYPSYPRPIEPIFPHLTDISERIKETGADVGFAHDCDADRVAIIDHNGFVYPEDITLALLVRFLLEMNQNTQNNQNISQTSKKPIIITNSASSLIFEKIAEKYGGIVIRTPIGERYLAIKLQEMMKNNPQAFIFGGEGSSGGFMFPVFNNARDGIFAACKICEMMAYTNKTLKELVESLPKFFSTRDKIDISNSNINRLIQSIRKEFDQNQIHYSIIDRDIKILNKEQSEWTLIHPSNTEPIIRIITESLSEGRSRNLCEEMSKKIRSYLHA